MIFLIKEHEPHASMIDARDKPWRAQKLYLDLLDKNIACRLFISTFDHWSKTQSTPAGFSKRFGKVDLLPAPAYPHNGSVLRFVSGILFAARYFWAGLKGTPPTHIIVACPGFMIACVSLLLKLRFGCKVYMDIRDRWPETLGGFFPAPLRPLAIAIFTLWLRLLLIFVDEVIVPSQSLKTYAGPLFRKEPVKIPFLIDATMASDLPADPDARDMIFVGSLSTFFDYDLFEEAASYCQQEGCIFHILGDGEFFETVRTRLGAHQSVAIHGRVNYKKIAEIAALCRTGLYPYRQKIGFENHETNKLTDYLTLGLLVLSSVPLPIEPRLWRHFPLAPGETLNDAPERSEIRAYGLAQFTGNYADRLIALSLLPATP